MTTKRVAYGDLSNNLPSRYWQRPSGCGARARSHRAASFHVGAVLRGVPLTIVYLCALCCLVASPSAHAQDERSLLPWETSLAVQLGYPFGFVQVGENQYPGNRLAFHRDLGVDLCETVNLALRYRFTPEDAVHVSAQMLFLDGSTTLPRDVFFNGTKLQSGTTLDTTTNFPDFFRLTAMYERYLQRPEERREYWPTRFHGAPGSPGFRRPSMSCQRRG